VNFLVCFPFWPPAPKSYFLKEKTEKKKALKGQPGKQLPKGNGISAAGWKSLETTGFYHYAVVFWQLV